MSDLAHVQGLMAGLGPLVEDVQEIRQFGEDRWTVVFDDVTYIDVQCNVPGNKLTFSMPIVDVEQEHRLEMYTTLLNYNMLWEQTGGIRMAVDADGVISMILDVFHLDLELGALAAIVENFDENAQIWRQAVERNSEDDGVDEEMAEDEKQVPGSMRV